MSEYSRIFLSITSIAAALIKQRRSRGNLLVAGQLIQQLNWHLASNMAFAPSPRHTLVNPSPNASPGSPFSPRDNLSPLASGSCSAVRPGSMNRRKSSGQTIQTLGRSKQHYIGSPGSVAGAGGRRKSSHHQLSAKPNGVVGNDGQWATMDPDEVFRRLNVKEVKKVEGILRSSAAGKQGELRSMVR
jgi:hypothetical protein